jgi:hypothetical protein
LYISAAFADSSACFLARFCAFFEVKSIGMLIVPNDLVTLRVAEIFERPKRSWYLRIG